MNNAPASELLFFASTSNDTEVITNTCSHTNRTVLNNEDNSYAEACSDCDEVLVGEDRRVYVPMTVDC